MSIAFRSARSFAGRIVALSAVVLIAASVAPWTGASAYTLKTLYSFCAQAGCSDGEDPESTVIMDGSGNLFGTTPYGGLGDFDGTVFELISDGHGNWTYKLLYSFCPKSGCKDGTFPQGGLIVDTAGNLYGMTEFGGREGSGTVYELSPNARKTKWKLNILYSFCSQDGCGSGNNLSQGPASRLTYSGASSGALYDGVSPLYGTTLVGGDGGVGSIFQLTPVVGTDKWKFKVLRNFDFFVDGEDPSSLLVDAGGNLYGTTLNGGTGAGTAFELSPNARKTKWNQTVLHSFCTLSGCADGGYPAAGMIMDASGTLFGTTGFGGASQHCPNAFGPGCGVAFKLAPNGTASQETLLHTFCDAKHCPDGSYPAGDMTMDASGNLFGSTYRGGGNEIDHYGQGGGTVFELNGTALTVLYRFCSQDNCADGEYPNGVIRDGSGNLYGTGLLGGANGGGSVFELVP